MADLLDFGKLLQDIAPSNPAGEDLREKSSSIYQTLKLAVDKARQAERKETLPGDPADTAKRQPADWEPVLNNALEALTSQTKDLEMAAWLTEALIRKHKWPGLRDGAKLMRQLVEKYWDRGLFPRVDDLSDRLRMVSALNGVSTHPGTLLRPINRAPLTQKIGDVGPLTLLDYQKKEREEGAGKKSSLSDQIAKAEVQTSASWKKEMAELITQCLSELKALEASLEQKCRGSTPFLGEELKGTLLLKLNEHSDAISGLLWDRLPEPLRQGLKGTTDESRLEQLTEQINAVAQDGALYDEKRFADVELSDETKELVAQKPTGFGLVRLNRILLEEAYGMERSSQAPSMSIVCAALEDCSAILQDGLPEAKEPKSEPSNVPKTHEQTTTQQAQTSSTQPVALDKGPIKSRKEAFQRLAELAQYFEDVEPHSPISSALRRIVAWENLKLPALLTELIEDQGARDKVFKLLGIPQVKK